MEAGKVGLLARRIHDEKSAAYRERKNQLDDLQSLISAANARITNAFKTFAHTQFVQNCAAFDQEVIDLAAEADAAKEKNQAQIAEVTAKIELFDQELASLALTLESARENVSEKLQSDDTFQGLERVLNESNNALLSNRAECEALLKEVSEKLPAFLEDDVFQYLLKIGFGTSAYKGKGFAARLDGMLARRTQFLTNKESLAILQGIKVEAEKRLAGLTKNHAAALKAYEDYQFSAFNSPEIVAITNAIDLQERERAAVQETLSTCLAEETQYLTAADGLSLSAKGLIYKFLQQQDPQLLARYAAETPSVEDDMALNVIQQELAAIEKLRFEMRDARVRFQDTENALKKAKDLLREIDRAPHLSNKHYKYASESDVMRLLDGFMAGANGTHELQNGLKRLSVYVAPVAPVHTPVPAVSRTSSFSSSGSVGGGSFKTTSSF
jgi:Negative regulator of septation ring formation